MSDETLSHIAGWCDAGNDSRSEDRRSPSAATRRWRSAGIWPLYHLTRLDQPRIGLKMLVLGVIASIPALVPRPQEAPAVIAGVLGPAAPAGFIMNVALSWQLSMLVDVAFIGMWLGLAGGLLATIRAPRAG